LRARARALPDRPPRTTGHLMPSTPLRVLVAGGGVAALEAVLALHALARHQLTIDLLAPGEDYTERQSSVLSPFTGAAVPHLSLKDLPVRHRPGALASIDADEHTVHTTDGGTLAYDRLLVATGAHPRDGIPGATQFRGPISAGTVE